MAETKDELPVVATNEREWFISGYISRSEISREFYDEHFVALPCECKDETCAGWATIKRDPERILNHIGLDLSSSYLKILEEVEALRKDAERYRWLRSQHWDKNTMCVVTSPKSCVKLGSICPSGELLDFDIDTYLSSGRSGSGDGGMG